VRHNGHEPRFGNLIPEFERCVAEASPDWFLMEEVPDAPTPWVDGYAPWSCLLNNRQLGEAQNRVRRWTFGVRGIQHKVLMIETVCFENEQFEYAATGGSHRGSLTQGNDLRRKTSMPFNAKRTVSFREICAKQGLPDDFDIPPFTVSAKCQAVGNGVPLAMGRAIAKAVREAIK
jgi:DNA (cytosine-5)-methyltransferase 1